MRCSGPRPLRQLPVTVHGRACIKHAEVLAELMRAAISHCGAERGTIQLRDRVHGVLRLEGRCGFGREFPDAFSQRVQVVVTDVDNSPLFSEAARRTLLMHDVHSCTTHARGCL